jgi:hypothetical protein
MEIKSCFRKDTKMCLGSQSMITFNYMVRHFNTNEIIYFLCFWPNKQFNFVLQKQSEIIELWCDKQIHVSFVIGF